MKNLFRAFILAILISLTSCQTRIVSPNKPFKDNKIELYQKYNIQTYDGQRMKIKVLRLDQDNIYGKTQKGEDIVLSKKDIREVRKFDGLISLGVIASAIVALLLIPV